MTKRTKDTKSLPIEPSLKDLLDQLVADCGEEYVKLHTGKQGFPHSNNRMNYYENKAIQQIIKLFPATRTIRLPAVNHRNSEYNRGYNSGYTAGKRTQGNDLASINPKATTKATNNPPKSSLDSILNFLSAEILLATARKVPMTGTLEAKKKAKAEIEQLILEIIEEDDLGGEDYLLSKRQAKDRNDLRAIQRQRLISLLGDKDEIV